MTRTRTCVWQGPEGCQCKVSPRRQEYRWPLGGTQPDCRARRRALQRTPVLCRAVCVFKGEGVGGKALLGGVSRSTRCSRVQAYLGKNLVAITTPIVTPIKRLRKKARGYDAKVGVVDSTRVGRAIFRFYFTELGL